MKFTLGMMGVKNTRVQVETLVVGGDATSNR